MFKVALLLSLNSILKLVPLIELEPLWIYSSNIFLWMSNLTPAREN